MNSGKAYFWDEGRSGELTPSKSFASLERGRDGLGEVMCIAWAPHGSFLAVGNQRGDIHIFDLDLSRPALIRILENTEIVTEIAFNAAGDLLIAALGSGTTVVWDCKIWQHLAQLAPLDAESDSISSTYYTERPYPSIAVHPRENTLALLKSVPLGKRLGMGIEILELDGEALRRQVNPSETIYYVNAKVLLLGDSGVGKTGLGLTLSGESFRPTDSTHGRHVWLLEADTIYTENKQKETRETFLWDLAGQPGYRLTHQLHLDGATVALVVFDAKNETDPFTGVRYWAKALRQAQGTRGEDENGVSTFLVAARTDRGAISASEARIAKVVEEYGFRKYFATSAREGRNVDELGEAIRAVIPWTSLPRVSSMALLYDIKEFLLQQKESGRTLTRLDDLLAAFSAKQAKHAPSLKREFATVIGRLESRRLLKQLSFGSLSLLQPEYLDAYASAIINTAKAEPDGLGSLAENDVL